MAQITANEVGVFRCRYHGIKACENPDYFMAKICFEYEIGGDIKDWNNLPKIQYLLHESEDANKFSSLQENHVYHIKMSIGYQSANERNGKTYPAGVKFRVIQVLGEAK